MAKKKTNPLLNPGTVVQGKTMRQAAKAATNLEYTPVINAGKRSLKEIARSRRRDDKGLAKLGRQTTASTRRTYNKTNLQMKHGIQSAIATGRDLQNETDQFQNEAYGRQDQLLGGSWAGQGRDLAAAGVAEGGSASEQAMREAIMARQSDTANRALAFQNVSASSAAGMEQMARNRLNANRMGRAEAITGIRTAVASRRMDSRSAYGEQEREARGSLKDARSLKGAAYVNNLMRLRDSERGFINERAAIMGDANEANQDYQLGLAEEQGRNDRDDGEGSDGGGGGDGPLEPEDRPNKMKPFFKEWLAKTNQVRNNEPIRPGHWNTLLDEVEKDKDPGWSGTQRNQFLRAYKKWYKRSGQGKR